MAIQNLNNYEVYINFKQIVDKTIKSLKFLLKQHEVFLCVRNPKIFDLTQTGILFLGLQLTAKALLKDLDRISLEVSDRFENSLP